jgi:hypothetical protein
MLAGSGTFTLGLVRCRKENEIRSPFAVPFDVKFHSDCRGPGNWSFMLGSQGIACRLKKSISISKFEAVWLRCCSRRLLSPMDSSIYLFKATSDGIQRPAIYWICRSRLRKGFRYETWNSSGIEIGRGSMTIVTCSMMVVVGKVLVASLQMRAKLMTAILFFVPCPRSCGAKPRWSGISSPP